MTKRLLASLLAVLMVVSMIPLTAFAATEAGGEVPSSPTATIDATAGKWEDTAYKVEFEENAEAIDAVKGITDDNTAVFSVTEEKLVDASSDVTEVAFAEANNESNTKASLTLTFSEALIEDTVYYLVITVNGQESIVKITVPDSQVEITSVELTLGDVVVGSALPEAEVSTVMAGETEVEKGQGVTVTTAWKKGQEEASGSAEEGVEYTATITVEAAEGYKLSETVSYKLDGENATPDKDGNITKTVTAAAAGTEKTNLSTATVELENAESITYDGTAKEPSVTVSIGQDDDKVELTENTDYTVKYSNNINAGTATVTVKAVEDSEYTGEATTTFAIGKGSPTVTWSPEKTETEYTGSAIDPKTFGTPIVKIGEKTIEAEITYEVKKGDKAAEFENAGEYSVTAKVEETQNLNAASSSPQTLKITKKTITIGTLALETDSFTYTGEEPELVLDLGDNTTFIKATKSKTYLTNDTEKSEVTEFNVGDYTTEYTIALADGMDAENVELSGETTQTFTWNITKASITDGLVINKGYLKWENTEKTEEIALESLTDKGTFTLTVTPEITGVAYDTDTANTVKLKYGGQGTEVPSGAQTIRVVATNANYTDTTFTINVEFTNKDVKTITVTAKETVEYDGQPHKGYTGTPAIEGVDTPSFTYSYVGRDDTTYDESETAPTNAGKYTLTISATGDNYVASESIDFEITKKAVTVKGKDISVEVGGTPAYDIDEVTGLVTGDTMTKDDFTLVENNKNLDEAGSYTYKYALKNPTDFPNYTITFTDGDVTVTEADTDTPTVTISGTAQVGQTLTATVKNAPAGKTPSYQWYTGTPGSGTEIAGATEQTYELTDAELGQTVYVVVTFSEEGGTATSSATAAVVEAGAELPTVTITGAAKVGQTLTADVSNAPACETTEYQWYTGTNGNEQLISGATNQTYTLTAAEQGKTVFVIATFKDAEDRTISYVVSDPTAAVAAASSGGTGGYNPGTGSGTTTPNPTPSTSPDPTTPPAPTPEPPKATVEPTVEGDTASGTVSGDTITDLIEEAGNDGAGEVVVQVNPSNADGVDVVKTELPAGSMKDLADANVDLTVSTPVADVTLPQETLKELGAGEGPVTVTAAQTDTGTAGAPATTITVTVEQGGAAVEAGVTATVPADVVSSMAGNSNGTVTVSTPVADVVLPNSTLTAAGKNDVSVSAVPTANGTSIEVKRNGVTMTNASVQVAVPVPETSDDSTVAYIVDANGNKTILPKSVAADGEMKVLLDTGKATITYQNNAKTFTDSASVPGWAKSSFTTSRELIKGIDNGNGGMAFRPNKTTTRAELVTMLHRLESEPTVGNVNFDDMKGNEWYKDAAAWAQTKGVVNGTDKGFEGNKTITRQELATMLYRYMQNVTGYKGKTGDYSGIAGGDKVNSWAAEAMRWAYGSGIITGKSDSAGNTNLDPAGLATRAEVSAMLERFVKLIAA